MNWGVLNLNSVISNVTTGLFSGFLNNSPSANGQTNRYSRPVVTAIHIFTLNKRVIHNPQCYKASRMRHGSL